MSWSYGGGYEGYEGYAVFYPSQQKALQKGWQAWRSGNGGCGYYEGVVGLNGGADFYPSQNALQAWRSGNGGCGYYVEEGVVDFNGGEFYANVEVGKPVKVEFRNERWIRKDVAGPKVVVETKEMATQTDELNNEADETDEANNKADEADEAGAGEANNEADEADEADEANNEADEADKADEANSEANEAEAEPDEAKNEAKGKLKKKKTKKKKGKKKKKKKEDKKGILAEICRAVEEAIAADTQVFQLVTNTCIRSVKTYRKLDGLIKKAKTSEDLCTKTKTSVGDAWDNLLETLIPQIINNENLKCVVKNGGHVWMSSLNKFRDLCAAQQ